MGKVEILTIIVEIMDGYIIKRDTESKFYGGRPYETILRNKDGSAYYLYDDKKRK